MEWSDLVQRGPEATTTVEDLTVSGVTQADDPADDPGIMNNVPNGKEQQLVKLITKKKKYNSYVSHYDVLVLVSSVSWVC